MQHKNIDDKLVSFKLLIARKHYEQITICVSI